MRRALVALALFFLPLLANAAWNQEAIDFSRYGFTEFPGPAWVPMHARSHMATVWGGGVRDMKMRANLGQDEFRVSLPEHFGKPIKVFLRPAHGDRDRIRKAPLMVFIPGIFGDADHAVAQAMAKWFSRMGYHVLTLPNCWSKDYHSALPKQITEYPNDEANAVLDLTRWAINELGPSNVAEVHIAGESLGALVSAVAYSKDSNSARPVFTGGATLMWPPIRLASSVEQTDRMIASTRDIYESRCRDYIKSLKTKLRIYRGKNLTSPNQDDVDCAASVVAHYSFAKNLRELAQHILKAQGRKSEADRVPESLTFQTFIRSYAPRYESALQSSDKFGHLDHWIRATKASSLPRMQILTSDDDFILAGETWDFLPRAGFKRNQIISLSWGGHVGASNHAAFRPLLEKQFARR